MMIEFTKFPKIPRLNRDMIITEKIDGTNAQIYVAEQAEIDEWVNGPEIADQFHCSKDSIFRDVIRLVKLLREEGKHEMLDTDV